MKIQINREKSTKSNSKNGSQSSFSQKSPKAKCMKY